MFASQFTTISKDGITVTAYPGDGAILLAFSLDQAAFENKSLAGFSIQRIPPIGEPYYLPNRLDFTHMITSGTTLPNERVWTPSDKAPFQKFHWVDFPPDLHPGQYRYKVAARFWDSANLVDGPSAELSVELVSDQPRGFAFGFTRGYLASRTYADKFPNGDIREEPKRLNYDTKPFEAEYQWLGFHARKLIFEFLRECVNDKSATVDLFAHDIDEPDLLKMLESFGPRLRIFLDDAPIHTGAGLGIEAHDRLVKSAGVKNVKQGHFIRFAHDNIIIRKKKGKPVKVLTSSADFTVRGLYVHANNVLVFGDPAVAKLYEQGV